MIKLVCLRHCKFVSTYLLECQMLDCVIDSDHGGVLKHLGWIADTMYKWEGPIADSLGLSQADVAGIKKAYPGELNLQA